MIRITNLRKQYAYIRHEMGHLYDRGLYKTRSARIINDLSLTRDLDRSSGFCDRTRSSRSDTYTTHDRLVRKN